MIISEKLGKSYYLNRSLIGIFFFTFDLNPHFQLNVSMIDTEKLIDDFFTAKGLSGNGFDFDNFINLFHKDMASGLAGTPSSMPMYPSYIQGDGRKLDINTPVAVIDAGGTNLRVAVIELNEDYSMEVSEFKKYSMPGVDREVSGEEFFRTIAEYALPVVKKTSRVGFCFSYPMRKESAFDGTLKAWSKEVKAPGVLNEPICENLKNALSRLGCRDLHITIFNDTVSTLLAGRTFNPVREYDGYMGLIMGTGLNTAYLELNKNITTATNRDKPGSQIINMESAMFNKCPRGEVDEAFIAGTENPHVNQLEKMCSGGYLGSLWALYLREAALADLFSSGIREQIEGLNNLQTMDMDLFLRNPFGEHGLTQYLVSGTESDIMICWKIADRLLDRASKLVAATISSVVLWTEYGKNPLRPVCICADGSTFYRLKGYKSRTEFYLKSYLEESRGRWVELVTVTDAPQVGAVVAGLTN